MRPVFAVLSLLPLLFWPFFMNGRMGGGVDWGQRSERYGRNLIRLTPAKGLHALHPVWGAATDLCRA